MPHVRRMGYLLSLIIGAALLTAAVWKPAPPPHFIGVGTGDVPRRLGGYSAPTDDVLPADVMAALASTDPLSRTYQRDGDAGDTVNFLLIGGQDRSALHDPRSCLIGAGMQLEDDHTELLPGTDVEARSCRAVGLPGQPGYDILYFYFVNGKIINRSSDIREAMLVSALLGRRGAPTYFLRFTRPLASSSASSLPAGTPGHDRLQRFATEMWTRLQPKLRPTPTG